MSFENTERIAALSAANVGTIFPQLVAACGEDLPDGTQMIRTIGAHWSDTAQTVIRAASLEHGTITGQLLTDGRVAYRCLWQTDLVAAWDAGQLPEVEELSNAQLNALLPTEFQ